MKIKVFLTSVFFLLLAAPVLAGGGHSHDSKGGHDHGQGKSQGHAHGKHLKGDAAIMVASDSVAAMVKKDLKVTGKKLPKSYENIPLEDKKVAEEGEDYFVVSMENKEEGSTLFVLISHEGEFFDANFSGTFKGVND